MSKATFVPAVTETKTVEVSPAKVTLELTIEEAKTLLAVIGACTRGQALMPLYRSLVDTFAVSGIPRAYLSAEERNKRGVNEDQLYDEEGTPL